MYIESPQQLESYHGRLNAIRNLVGIIALFSRDNPVWRRGNGREQLFECPHPPHPREHWREMRVSVETGHYYRDNPDWNNNPGAHPVILVTIRPEFGSGFKVWMDDGFDNRKIIAAAKRKIKRIEQTIPN